MFEFLLSLFRPVSIDSIVGDVHRKVAQLRALANTKSRLADSAEEQAAVLQDRAEALNEEADQADRIASNFDALLS